MITVRQEELEDQEGIETVRAAATAKHRETYRPGQEALVNKARIRVSLKRLVAVDNGLVVGTVQYSIENEFVRVIGLGVPPDRREKVLTSRRTSC